ncbi:MAG: Na(+)/H(+) antiporter subunit D, partial [Alphaproteobacteria bacterium]
MNELTALWTSGAIPPGALLILGGVLIALGPRALRPVFVLGFPVAALAAVWQVPDGVSLSAPFLDFTLELVKGDKLSRLFGTIFALMALLGGLFALNQRSGTELAAAFIYAGCALGVVFSGDLLSVFIFWEMMAIASGVVIWSAGTEAARASALRYYLVHFLGGVLLMVGIIGLLNDTGDLTFRVMQLESAWTWLILAGFLINAGAPPLSAWIGDAYPEASWSGTVFLSAFTTKTAVYVLLRGFPGAEILIFVGLYMIFYGIIYALLENDMRRILAYSIVNQVGFMVCAIGLGSPELGGTLALNGAASHAFAHIIYKALLLMSAGAVLYMTGRRKCSGLGGLFRTMPVTTICGIIGALSISAFPLTSGFVTKSMINDAAAGAHLMIVWMLLTAASAGVFLHAGIKFPWFVFFQKDSGLRPPDPPWNMKLAMILMSGLCIGIGVYPAPLYEILPFEVNYVPYTAAHVTKLTQLLLFSGLAFFLLLP